MIREQARMEVRTSLYLYRRIFNLPRNDPRLETVTDLEMEVEVESNRLFQRLLAGKSIDYDDWFESDPEAEDAMNALINDGSDDDSMWEDVLGIEPLTTEDTDNG